MAKFFAPPRTVRGRLVAASAGSILVAVIVFAVASILLIGHQLRTSLDDALRGRALQVAQLAVSAPAVLTDPGALESPVAGRQIAVEVVDARDRILARSQTLGVRLLPQDALVQDARSRGRSGFEEIRIGNRRFRMFVAPIAEAGGPAAGGAVLVASDTTDIRHTISHLGFVLAISGAVVALLAAVVAGVLTGRGLAPLRRLADDAEEIERTGDPARRLSAAPDAAAATADEVTQLTGVLNRMLASLERSRANERRFLADASHELRTPVTTLLGNVEYAARHGADPEVLADLKRDAARLARLVDDLLVLERQADATHQPQPIALDRLVAEVAAEHEEVQLNVSGSVTVSGEEDALRRLVENLIENAILHGPDDRPVEVALTRVDASALLSVTDEGTGPSPKQRERLFERFWRGPEAAGRPGSGLGLAIAAAIAERHGGQVHVNRSTFTVELPCEKST